MRLTAYRVATPYGYTTLYLQVRIDETHSVQGGYTGWLHYTVTLYLQVRIDETHSVPRTQRDDAQREGAAHILRQTQLVADGECGTQLPY